MKQKLKKSTIAKLNLKQPIMSKLAKPGGMILLLLLTFYSRKKEEGITKTEQIDYIETSYNQDLDNLAKAVNSALVNKSFRNLIKNEAQKKLDGDFNILLKNVTEKPIESHVKSSSTEESIISVKTLLNDCFRETSKTNLKTGTSTIDDLLKLYPDLQISVPVHNEKWDPEKFSPKVCFVPEEYEDGVTEYVPAYNNEGKKISIDAINEPNEPVIVIGQSERMRIIDPGDGEVTPPPTPTNLRGSSTQAGIGLMWDMPYNIDIANTRGYYVYRKRPDDTYYKLLSTVNGAFNRSYDDNSGSIEPGGVYKYYVRAYNSTFTSSASNYITVTAPFRPNPVLSFEAIQHSINEIELRWQNDNSQYISTTDLYRKIVGVNSDYVKLKGFTPDQHDYFDFNITPGKKNIYKVRHATPLGVSNDKYDFVQIPYRDISQNSAVYIKELFCSDIKGVEGWINGTPEFYISIANVSEDKTPYMVQEKLDFRFPNRGTYHDISDRLVMNWKPGFWYDMISIHVIEYDRLTIKVTASFGVGYNKKNEEKTSFTAKGGVDISYETSKFKNCGVYHLSYYDYPDQWVEFPNYGFKILFGRTRD